MFASKMYFVYMTVVSEVESMPQNVGLEILSQAGHNRVSTFWTKFIQRAGQAEIAVRINKAHKDAERHLHSNWNMLKVS